MQSTEQTAQEKTRQNRNLQNQTTTTGKGLLNNENFEFSIEFNRLY